MSRQLTAQTQPQVQDTSTPANAVLQRTCACGQHTIAGGECASCHQEQPGLQRKAINQFKPASPPPPAPYANSSFSQVQVHTAGSEIIQPKLTVSRPGDKYEREADRVADTVLQMPESSASNGAMRASSSQPLAIQRLQPKPETDLQRQTDDVAVEEEEEEEKGVANLQAKETPGQSGTVSPGLENRVQSIKGGQPLPPSTRTFFEPRFGHDFSQVRLHTGPEAASTAKSINAHAFTKGQNIYFGTGQFQPETQPGRKLLAHELTHTIQQGNTSPSASLEGAAQSSLSVSHPNDSLEHEAKTVANHVEADQSLSPNAITVGANDAQTTLARLAESDTAPATTPEATPAPASTDTTPPIEVTPPTEPISLAGSETFAPSSAWDSYLESRGEEGATVPVRLGNIARGQIPIRKSNETFRTMGERHQSVALSHTALQPLRDAGIQPVLAVIIRQSTIEGYATIATEQGAAGNPQAVVDWIKNHATEMGWAGLDVSQIPNVTNELSGGALRLQLTGFRFTLGGFMNGTGDFGLVNEAVTFNAQATVRVRNITEAQLELEQNEQGNLTGQVELPVSIANFSGNLLAQYGNGTVNIEGTIGYSAEKFSGEVTLLVTDQATARNVARRRLSPDQIAASANQSAGQGEAESGPRPGPRALAGFGTLNFAFTEWMTGRAEVIVDSEGHITVIGEIAPPAEVELFPQRDYIRDIFTLEIRTLYGVPLVGNAFFFANIGMQAMAKLGPGKIYNIAIRGTYSTDPAVLQNYELEATLNISAFAGLRLRAEGGVGIELLGHDIKVGVGIFALAGVQGYVEATPTIGYRETADPQEGRQGEYFIKGHMEIAAQPFLGLGGDLFVELDSPWWSPAPDKKWTWPLGQLEYPLPGEFGIGADVDYVVGSDELPEIQFGEVDFNKDKFMSDLMNDHVPPKTQGEQERQGEWQEGETTGESAEPTLTDSAGAPAQTPARGRREAGEGEAPAPEVQQRWLQGLRAVGDLAERSQRDPYTETEIDAALAQLKTEHGFNTLRAEQVGEDWGVVAEMNPRKKKTDPPRIEAEEDSAESTRTPAEDEQTQPNTVQQELGEFISSLETRIQTTTDTNIANKLKKILKRARRAGNRLNRRSRSPEQISQDLSTLKRQVDNLSTEVPSTEPERPTGPTQHPPGTRFKKPIPGMSEHDKASDIPGWVRDEGYGFPTVDESHHDFARRVMDGKYGRGNWKGTGPTSDYSKIQKWAKRHFPTRTDSLHDEAEKDLTESADEEGRKDSSEGDTANPVRIANETPERDRTASEQQQKQKKEESSNSSATNPEYDDLLHILGAAQQQDVSGLENLITEVDSLFRREGRQPASDDLVRRVNTAIAQGREAVRRATTVVRGNPHEVIRSQSRWQREGANNWSDAGFHRDRVQNLPSPGYPFTERLYVYFQDSNRNRLSISVNRNPATNEYDIGLFHFSNDAYQSEPWKSHNR